MPYVVTRGEVIDGGRRYKCGEFVPGVKGELADMEAVGAVKWVEQQPREPSARRTKAVK